MNRTVAGPDGSADDGSFRVRGRNILDLRTDSGETVRQYLAGLLRDTLNRPGSAPLIAVVRGALAKHGMLALLDDDADDSRSRQLISDAIEVMGSEPFRPIGMKTGTERRLAQLQRGH